MNYLFVYFGEESTESEEILDNRFEQSGERHIFSAGRLSHAEKDRFFSEFCAFYGQRKRRYALVFTLPPTLSAFDGEIREWASALSFISSVSRIAFAEAASSARKVMGKDRQILFCGERETRLFTKEGEKPLFGEKIFGTGFLDLLGHFIGDGSCSLSELLEKRPEMDHFFRRYRYFSSSRREMGKKEYREKRLHGSFYKTEGPIDFFTLPEAVRKQIEKKQPVFTFSLVKENGLRVTKKISIERFTGQFAYLYEALHEEELDKELIAFGTFADFPLLADYLASRIDMPVTLRVVGEGELMLKGMRIVSMFRLKNAELSLFDLAGRPLLLWNDPTDRVRECEISVLLPREIASGSALPVLRYARAFEMPIFRTPKDPSPKAGNIGGETVPDRRIYLKKVKCRESGDLFCFCYEKDTLGNYRLKAAPPEDGSTLSKVTLRLEESVEGLVASVLAEVF